MDMIFLTHLWYSFNNVESALEGGAFSNSYTMSQRSLGNQYHLHFELQEAKFFYMEIVHDSSPFSFKICHLILENKVCTFKTFKLWP